MHHIHKTEAVVLAHKNTNEANRVYFLYTRDFGLIYATAQSVRKSVSKLNPHLQDFSVINIDLVRGRDVWRITNARRENPLIFAKNHEQLKFAKRFSDLILRLCKGEDDNVLLFEHIKDVYMILQKDSSLEIASIEIISILRTLHLLGYIPEHPISSPFLSGPLSSEVFKNITPHTRELVRTINQSLKETQL